MKIKLSHFIVFFSFLCVFSMSSQAHKTKKEALVVATLDLGTQESFWTSLTTAVNWMYDNGLRIVVAGLAVQSGLELIPVVDAVSVDSSPCLMPIGTYKGSCRDMRLTSFTHQGLPQSCKLTAKCKHIYEGMAEAFSEFIFLQHHEMTLKNDNGTLVALSEKKIPLPSKCEKILGSYALTCPGELVEPLGLNTNNRGICQLVVRCKTVKGSELENSIYYLSYEKDKVRLENCDGRLVIHRDNKEDHSCSGISKEDVEKMGNIYGKTYHRLDKGEL